MHEREKEMEIRRYYLVSFIYRIKRHRNRLRRKTE